MMLKLKFREGTIGRHEPETLDFDMMVRTANGRLTAAEVLGHREFIMTKLYESA